VTDCEGCEDELDSVNPDERLRVSKLRFAWKARL